MTDERLIVHSPTIVNSPTLHRDSENERMNAMNDDLENNLEDQDHDDQDHDHRIEVSEPHRSSFIRSFADQPSRLVSATTITAQDGRRRRPAQRATCTALLEQAGQCRRPARARDLAFRELHAGAQRTGSLDPSSTVPATGTATATAHPHPHHAP